jgi:hypothetical protein
MPMDLLELLPPAWRDVMKPYLDVDTVARLSDFVAAEYERGPVYPPLADLFTAFRLCSPGDARVLILGQDPYHKPGQAHGLSFSVRPGVAIPPSLRNVFKELRDDLGVEPPATGDLTGWASHGVLLLNAVLTVRAATPASHAGDHGPQRDAPARGLRAVGHLRAPEGRVDHRTPARGDRGRAPEPDEPARLPRHPPVQRRQRRPGRVRPTAHPLVLTGPGARPPRLGRGRDASAGRVRRA